MDNSIIPVYQCNEDLTKSSYDLFVIHQGFTTAVISLMCTGGAHLIFGLREEAPIREGDHCREKICLREALIRENTLWYVHTCNVIPKVYGKLKQLHYITDLFSI